MTGRQQHTSPLHMLHELTQWVPADYCVNECRGCCQFLEAYWLPRILAAEEAVVGYSTVGLRKTAGAMSCEFLDPGQHHCRIYARRPFECRLYPFLLNRRQGTLDLVAHKGCPFVARHLGSEMFRSYSRFLKGLLASAPVRALLLQETGCFHTYPDVELYPVQHDVIRASRPRKP